MSSRSLGTARTPGRSLRSAPVAPSATPSAAPSAARSPNASARTSAGEWRAAGVLEDVRSQDGQPTCGSRSVSDAARWLGGGWGWRMNGLSGCARASAYLGRGVGHGVGRRSAALGARELLKRRHRLLLPHLPPQLARLGPARPTSVERGKDGGRRAAAAPSGGVRRSWSTRASSAWNAANHSVAGCRSPMRARARGRRGGRTKVRRFGGRADLVSCRDAARSYSSLTKLT